MPTCRSTELQVSNTCGPHVSDNVTMPAGMLTELDILLQSLGLSKTAHAPTSTNHNDELHPESVEEVIAQANTAEFTSETRYQEVAEDAHISTASLNANANYTPRAASGRRSVPFTPYAPDSIEATGLRTSEVGDILLKCLLNRGVETGTHLASYLGLRFGIVESLLRQLKQDRYVLYKGSVTGHDYLYELTDLGREYARELYERCSYFGTAPVPLEQYVASVKAQSLEFQKPALKDIRNAFYGLQLKENLLSNIGQAIHSGRGMFLYGPPGNGKTSLAQCVSQSFGDSIWIPRSISAAGEIVRLFDPNLHRPVEQRDDASADGRWVEIERPTIMAGGELRMDDLEIQYIRGSGVGEAPLQMKANGGTLLIDDFGRQRMNIDELLNRWIVPLEQRHDFLHLESGRTIQVPFDQLIIFSSNLEPRDLVDDAFLRRIPYKISVRDPIEQEYRQLFEDVACSMDFKLETGVLNYLIQEHYVRNQRPFRYCHPRDLCRQIENRCSLHELPRIITSDAIDQAIENYFAIV